MPSKTGSVNVSVRVRILSFVQLLVELKFQLIPFCRTFLANVFLSVQLLNVLAFSIGPKAYAVIIVRVPSRVGPLRFYCSTATAHNVTHCTGNNNNGSHWTLNIQEKYLLLFRNWGPVCHELKWTWRRGIPQWSKSNW